MLFNAEIIISCVALFVACLSLFFAVRQTSLALNGLKLTRKSIRLSDLNRQVELLPKHQHIIHVQCHLDRWEKHLTHNRELLLRFSEKSYLKLLNKLKVNITHPTHLGIRKVEVEYMPSWLGEVYLSAAQYYYNAMSAVASMKEAGVIKKSEDVNQLLLTVSEASQAISSLRKILTGMVPKTILNTPASISNKSFFIDESNPVVARKNIKNDESGTI